LGTFRPIETESLDEHLMHSEWGEVSATASTELNATRAAGGRIIAVGTTVTRLLETAVRSLDEEGERGRVGEGEIQRRPDVSPSPHLPFSPSGRAHIPPWQGRTDLFIRPPFEFRAVDVLMTNFHFPRTTLLVLVQTFGGRELIAEAYRQAIREEYRFYSYGDAMLVV
jgi:S-adenosylmethionine:tRNA ribosyltransferase-isomerase